MVLIVEMKNKKLSCISTGKKGILAKRKENFQK